VDDVLPSPRGRRSVEPAAPDVELADVVVVGRMDVALVVDPRLEQDPADRAATTMKMRARPLICPFPSGSTFISHHSPRRGILASWRRVNGREELDMAFSGWLLFRSSSSQSSSA
jgi:hypothetical protein